jgi:hypothetical protein
MSTPVIEARLAISQWEDHDKFRTTEGEMDLFGEPQGVKFAREIVRLDEANASLLAACKKDAERIQALCRMVNGLAGRLGLGNKVRAEDWDDLARAALAKATH